MNFCLTLYDSIYLLLQPRKIFHKYKQKKKTFSSHSEQFLNYGDFGLITLKALKVSAKQIFNIKIYLKKATKKPDLTKRFVWFNLFPHLPLSKKSKGMRMGKGVGKLST
jgi:ribosomal protein L16/L10AE